MEREKIIKTVVLAKLDTFEVVEVYLDNEQQEMLNQWLKHLFYPLPIKVIHKKELKNIEII